MNDKVFKIFVDFDGTISRQDVGDSFLNFFGDPEKNNEVVKLWMEDKISSPELWIMLFKTIRGFSEERFNEFLQTMEIDPTFAPFVQYCRENSFELRVLSDGFDLYIKRLIERENIKDLEIFCNKALIKDNVITPVFPYGDEECKQCGNCKRNHILSNSGDDDYLIYIGDGYSDKCPIQYCDFVFAKDSLLRYCEMNRITFFPFKDFNDVIKKINELKSKKRLKKLHQAELKRREVFKQG